MNKNKKNKNCGIAFLRLWMCYEVVIDHFYDFNSPSYISHHLLPCIFLKYGRIAVPVFFIIRFSMIDFESYISNHASFSKRMKRLLTPHIFWAFFYYFVHQISFYILGKGSFCSIKDLILQLLFGHTINQAMWFQVAIIFIS